jgi:hypothetical protein
MRRPLGQLANNALIYRCGPSMEPLCRLVQLRSAGVLRIFLVLVQHRIR